MEVPLRLRAGYRLVIRDYSFVIRCRSWHKPVPHAGDELTGAGRLSSSCFECTTMITTWLSTWPNSGSTAAASQQAWPDKLEGTLIVGELSLDRAVHHTKDVLPMAALARREVFKQVIVPAVN